MQWLQWLFPGLGDPSHRVCALGCPYAPIVEPSTSSGHLTSIQSERAESWVGEPHRTRLRECLLLALFGHPTCTDECLLSGVKRT